MILKGERIKRGQLTIMILVAILIVAVIILFFYFSRVSVERRIPHNMRPVYDSYLDCLEGVTRDGVYLLGFQGGYIDVPDFVGGSSYRPFSNQLDFMGFGVPYWLYVSGNNILSEQIPSKGQMELELENYIRERLEICNFRDYEVQGFGVYVESGDVEVKIRDSSVDVIARNPLNIYFENDSVRVSEHNIKLNVRLGKIYDMAKKLYEYEKSEMFLEEYAIDVLRLYAPVDGVELGCKPISFSDGEIKSDLKKGFSANMNSLKVEGSYYELNKKDNEYFVVEPGFSSDVNVNFLYNPLWPSRIEIYGDRMAQPVGMQEGLSILGFCYVPYHLVYDVNFPVLVQFWEDDFFFQFPLAVIIEKNYKREALPLMFDDVSLESEVCKYKNQDLRVYTYDGDFNPVSATLQFSCLDSLCYLGESKIAGSSAVYDGDAPGCVNGFVIATSEGYAQSKQMVSTNVESEVNLILKKIYSISLDLGDIKGNSAVIYFKGEDYATSVNYPDSKKIDLVEDFYNVSVFVYSDSSLKFEGINERICVDVPVFGGLGGVTEEKCNDVNIPSMDVDYALVGGGNNVEYVTEDILKRKSKLNLEVELFSNPESLEDLEKNNVLLEDSVVYISYD
jgi:hypothetical protein